MGRRQLDGGRVGLECLHDGAPRLRAAATAPGDLAHQLKGPLRCSEVRQVERGICIHHAHQANAWEVQSLGNHLCTHQEPHFTGAEAPQRIMEIVGVLHGICINAQHGCSWHQRWMKPRQFLLDTLHTKTEHRNLLATHGARARQFLLALAMMAAHVLRGSSARR